MKKCIAIICLLCLSMSCDDVIFVEDISGRAVYVLAPTDESVLDETDVTFTWEQVQDAEKYHIQIAKPSFQDAQQILTDSTISSLNFNKTLEIGEYEWRVRGENSEYHTPYATQSFVIE